MKNLQIRFIKKIEPNCFTRSNHLLYFMFSNRGHIKLNRVPNIFQNINIDIVFVVKPRRN